MFLYTFMVSKRKNNLCNNNLIQYLQNSPNKSKMIVNN